MEADFGRYAEPAPLMTATSISIAPKTKVEIPVFAFRASLMQVILNSGLFAPVTRDGGFDILYRRGRTIGSR